MNATRAYRAAGYSVKSDKTAATNGSMLLRNKKVAEALTKAKKSRSERTKIDADWLLSRLADEAEADIADLYTDEGSLKPVNMWPEIWRKGLVSGIDVEQRYAYEGGDKVPDGIITKIKLSDRIKRLELIGRHVDVSAFNLDKIVVPTDINLVINRPRGD